MSIWNKVFTAIKGSVNEVGEAIVDSNALRILDQEIREADEELRRSKSSLTNIMAKHKLSKKKIEEFKTQIAEYEGYAVKALEKGDESLAAEVADRIAGLEEELATENDLAAGFAASQSQLRKAVSTAEANLKRLKQQVDTVKATESVQKAQAAVAARHAGANSKMRTAVDSLERLKTRQKERAAQYEAATELADADEGSALDARLRSAGIKDGANRGASDVLARLKARQGN